MYLLWGNLNAYIHTYFSCNCKTKTIYRHKDMKLIIFKLIVTDDFFLLKLSLIKSFKFFPSFIILLPIKLQTSKVHKQMI